MRSNTHNRRSFSRQALVSLSVCVSPSGLLISQLSTESIRSDSLSVCRVKPVPSVDPQTKRGVSGSVHGHLHPDTTTHRLLSSSYKMCLIIHAAPDHVTSPGVLSFSLLYGAFISLLYERQSFPNLAVSGTSCKRWRSPHCSLATASLSLHPGTISPLYLPLSRSRSRSQLLGTLGRVCKQKPIPLSPVIGGAVFPAAL